MAVAAAAASDLKRGQLYIFSINKRTYFYLVALCKLKRENGQKPTRSLKPQQFNKPHNNPFHFQQQIRMFRFLLLFRATHQRDEHQRQRSAHGSPRPELRADVHEDSILRRLKPIDIKALKKKKNGVVHQHNTRKSQLGGGEGGAVSADRRTLYDIIIVSAVPICCCGEICRVGHTR